MVMAVTKIIMRTMSKQGECPSGWKSIIQSVRKEKL